MAAGQRPISNVVDITNYVMLLTGQPLHAFDLDRVAGAQLTVRRARDGEQVETLDGQTRTLDDEMVLIDDDDGPTSIAGVMGGARSEVQPDTTRVLMEAANWDGANIHRTSLKLGLRSEASARFEKQLQPEQAMEAQAVATRLMIELCGARLAPGTIDVGGAGPPPQTIRLRDARVTSLLGAPIPRARCAEILAGARVPDRRRARRPRRDRPAVPPRRRHPRGRPDRGGRAARRAREAALDAALPPRRSRPAHPAPAAAPARRRRAHRPGPARGRRLELHRPGARPTGCGSARARARETVELENPMSTEQSLLRTTLLGSLLDVAQRNRARGAGHAAAVRGRRGVPARPRRAAAARALPRRRAADRPGAAADLARRRGPPRPTSSRSRACSQGLLDALRVPTGRLVRATRAVPASRPVRRDPGRRRARRLDRGDPSARRGAVGSATTRSPRSSSTSTRSPCRTTAALPRGDELPRGARGPGRGRRRARHARRRCSTLVRRAGGRCWPAPRCSTCTATPSSSARATCRWRCGSPTAPPTGR